jgi:hypothetical protein
MEIEKSDELKEKGPFADNRDFGIGCESDSQKRPTLLKTLDAEFLDRGLDAH